MNDKNIVDLYFNRDEEAITQIDKKYGRYCYSIAYNILTNKEDAEESVSDTLFDCSRRKNLTNVRSVILFQCTLLHWFTWPPAK